MTAWTDLVKKTWNQNKGKSGYKFKDALVDAKKVYKKGSTAPSTSSSTSSSPSSSSSPTEKRRKGRKSSKGRSSMILIGVSFN